jgi:hypothetical protein
LLLAQQPSLSRSVRGRRWEKASSTLWLPDSSRTLATTFTICSRRRVACGTKPNEARDEGLCSKLDCSVCAAGVSPNRRSVYSLAGRYETACRGAKAHQNHHSNWSANSNVQRMTHNSHAQIHRD